MPVDVFELDENLRSVQAVQIRLSVRASHRKKLNERLMRDMARNWPLAVGIVLAFFAPSLRDLAACYEPWGMRILLPAVALINCQRANLGPGIAAIAGQIALYCQFPIEGAIIKSRLKGHVSLGAAVGHLAVFHFLAIVLLWLLGNSRAV